MSGNDRGVEQKWFRTLTETEQLTGIWWVRRNEGQGRNYAWAWEAQAPVPNDVTAPSTGTGIGLFALLFSTSCCCI